MKLTRVKPILRFVERTLACAGLFFLIFHAGFNVSEITSGSMAPTLQGEGGQPDNDWVLYERVSSGPPPRNKLLVFTSPEGVRIAKRVVGYPGERLRIEDGTLVVDGVPRSEPGIRYLQAGVLRPREDGPAEHTVAEGTVFVLGDDSSDSWDSRFTRGLPEQKWEGRVVAVVWPPSRWRWLW